MVASMAQFQIFVVVFLGLLGKLDESTFDGNDGQFIGVLLVVLTVLVILSVLVLLVCESKAEENEHAEEFRSLERLTGRLTKLQTERNTRTTLDDRKSFFQVCAAVSDLHSCCACL